MKFGLSEDNIDKINGIFAKYKQIDEVILYGSRAMATNRDGSDIDLAIKGSDLNISILSKINSDLDDLLLPYKFDISNLSQIKNKDLLDHIDRVGVCFYNKSTT